MMSALSRGRALRRVRERRVELRRRRRERDVGRVRPRPDARDDGCASASRPRARRRGRDVGPGPRDLRGRTLRRVRRERRPRTSSTDTRTPPRRSTSRDRIAGTTRCASVATGGAPGSFRTGDGLGISADGRFVAFREPGREPRRGRHETDGRTSSSATSTRTVVALLCEPGAAGVTPLPVRQPGGRSGTRLPELVGDGRSRPSKPSDRRSSPRTTSRSRRADRRRTRSESSCRATRSSSAARPYGQGVRCVGGSLLWLFTKARRRAGAMTVPDAAAGEPSISARARPRSATRSARARPGGTSCSTATRTCSAAALRGHVSTRRRRGRRPWAP
jgi:hypothetical protein